MVRYLEGPLVRPTDNGECAIFNSTIFTELLSQQAISEKFWELFHGMVIQTVFNVTELVSIRSKLSQ